MSEEEPIANFNQYLSMPQVFFRNLGTAPYEKRKRNICIILLRQIIFWISFVNFNMTIVFEIIYLYKAMGQFSTFLEATALAPCLGFCVITNYKLGSLYFQHDLISNFLDVMSDYFPKTREEQDKFNTTEFTNRTLYIEKYYSFVMSSVIWLFNFSGVCQTIIEFKFLDMPFVQRYAYFLWYPFEIDTYWKYGIVYAQQCHAGFIAGWGTLASDILMISMVNLCLMQFEYLQMSLKSIQPHKTREDFEKIYKIISHHQTIVKLSEDINEIFSMAILFNLLAASMIICLVGFQVTAGTSALELFKYFLFLVFELIQVWTICYLGDKLIQSSTGVADAAFNQNWFEGDVTYQKTILLIITRSQKPAIINAKSFAIVSLESFTKVFSISYQFFTLLRTVYSK